MNQCKMGLIGGALLLGSLAINSEASVIYNWYDVASDSDVGPITASIAFDESIWSSGGTFVYNGTPGSAVFLPYFGVNSINFATYLGSDLSTPVTQGFTDPIELSQSTCGQHAPAGQDPSAYCAARGMAVNDLVVDDGYWKFDLQFGEFLQGSMYLNDLFTSVAMSSQGPLFTINQLNSDSPGPCFLNPGSCVGGTGVWRLQVSEPSTVLLLMLGLIPLAVAHRRRVTKRRAAMV